MLQHTRRSFRGLVIAAIAAAAIALSGGSALGAHQLSQTGTPGAWALPDSAGDPAARCSYDGGGVAGGTYLTGIRLRNDVDAVGHDRRPPVGGLPAASSSTRWTASGSPSRRARSSPATPAVPSSVVLSGRPDVRSAVSVQPKHPFRLVLKLIWYTGDRVGRRAPGSILVDSYVPRDGGVAGRCAGFVSDFDPGAPRAIARPGPSPERPRSRLRTLRELHRDVHDHVLLAADDLAPAELQQDLARRPRRTAPRPARRAAGTRSRPRHSPA